MVPAAVAPAKLPGGITIKSGKLREVTDVRDAIDLNGFKLTFDLKKDANPQVVLNKIYKKVISKIPE